MATKKIVTSVTLHIPAKGHTPFEFDAFSNRIGGKYAIDEVPPGSVVELDADEADALIAAERATAFEDKAAPAAEKTAAKPVAA
jgi:hypothetical protein